MDTLILYIGAIVLFAVSALKDREKTGKAFMKGLKALEGILPQFLAVLVFVAIILAVFDAEMISRFIGEKTGIIGSLAAGLLGAVTLIPGFVAFPMAGELLRNGAGTVQIATFVSSLMMVGIVTLPMEIKYFGKRAAIARNSFAFIFSFIAAVFVAWAVAL
ncbi:MAG TPA: permease [Treponema sp.]|nr:MAG: permease [Treponema sp. GWA1_62_8]OHE75709.1 MAG: permease [Treponema sp. RIFOXYC1_FULL_61_9]HCM29021.1 permease [Treponema sp.]